MNGESVALSTYSLAVSLFIDGANGRHHSRNFTALFTFAVISGSRGSAKNRPSPQRAWAKLHPSLKPAENFALTQQLCRCRRRIAHMRVSQLVSLQRGLDRAIVKRRAEIRVPHRSIRQSSAAIEIRRKCRA